MKKFLGLALILFSGMFLTAWTPTDIRGVGGVAVSPSNPVPMHDYGNPTATFALSLTATSTPTNTVTGSPTPTPSFTPTVTPTPTFGSVQDYSTGVSAVPTASAGGTLLKFLMDLEGRLVTSPYAPMTNYLTKNAAVSLAATTQFIAGATAGNQQMILGIRYTSSSTSVTNGDTTIYLLSGAVTFDSFAFRTVTAGTTGWVASGESNRVINIGNGPVSLVCTNPVTVINVEATYIQVPY